MSKKIALITGATGGIGLATAEVLGNVGYTVILNGIVEAEGKKAVEKLTALGIESEYFNFDVTNEEAVNQGVKAIGEKYGHIDALVNNAGGLGGRMRFDGMTTEFYRNVMALNLDSVFYVTREIGRAHV